MIYGKFVGATNLEPFVVVTVLFSALSRVLRRISCEPYLPSGKGTPYTLVVPAPAMTPNVPAACRRSAFVVPSA